MMIDGTEYLTKDEAAARCREYVKAHPGTAFHNHASGKYVRRPATDSERANGLLTITVYGWQKERGKKLWKEIN